MVTGSSGHLGEALVRVLRARGESVIGLDLLPSPYTDVLGSICDETAIVAAMAGADAVVHTATLHQPHIASHRAAEFVETNISGTARLLDAAAKLGVERFVFASTTSAFGKALHPASGHPASWITEKVASVPKNIYGVSKVAAEDLCQLAYEDRALASVVLRIARFFPEDDDSDGIRRQFSSENSKTNELLFRRVDLADAVRACQAALERAPMLGFARYVISATTPFGYHDLADLRIDTPSVVRKYFPDFESIYETCGWRMFPNIDRVYVNAKARKELGWKPEHDFAWALERLSTGLSASSELARAVGMKGLPQMPASMRQLRESSMLEMRAHCERCRSSLPLDAHAYICSYECTFCSGCADAMGAVCPNCGGELLVRPRRQSGPGS